MMSTRVYSVCIFFVLRPMGAQSRPPIIDMHLHAHRLADYGGGRPVCANNSAILYLGLDPRAPVTPDSLSRLKRCTTPVLSSASDDALMRETFAFLDRYNIIAVAAGRLDRVAAWRAANPDRIIPANPVGDAGSPTPDEIRRLVDRGDIRVLAEVSPQYDGRWIDDASLEPYFALAEELDVPVGVHLGEGPYGAPYGPSPAYRARLTSPFQLEEVLARHPRLRVYVMHYGSPLVDEMIAVMYVHPQVYIDIGGNDWQYPRPHFYAQLKRFMDAGLGKRIMWGSDQLIWPRTIEIAIQTIERAPFLTADQKRDIFYNNAARFLRFGDADRARHRRSGRPRSTRD
jgi:uncharacterized protein